MGSTTMGALLLLAVALAAHLALAQPLPMPCTDCWCVPETGPQGKCPDLSNRIQFYPQNVIDQFTTYEISPAFPPLSPPGCNPFPSVAAFLSNQTGSTIPPCDMPPDAAEGSVCAFVYDKNDCGARKVYSLNTFKNHKYAKKAGAIVTHEGACGICSSAQDLAVVMNPTFTQTSFNCANKVRTEGLPAAIQCFVDLGMTQDCSLLFSSNGIADVLGGCEEPCNKVIDEMLPPNDPETCDLNDCLACDQQVAEPTFIKFAGRTRRNSGIVNAGVKRECEEIADIGQDPCAVADSSDDKQLPECHCEAYLKAPAWQYLHKYGIQFPDFCCQVGFANYCYESYGSPKGQRLAGLEDVEGEPLSGSSHLGYCIEWAGLGKFAYKYPDHSSSSGTYLSPEAETGYGGGQNVQGGYYSPCYHAKSYHDYVSCVFETYFKEALQACYCYYRSAYGLGCTESDCDKDIDLDLSLAYYEAETVCNQCPSHDGSGSGSGGYDEPHRPYGYGHDRDYGYDTYLTGESYDPCTGYCVLTEYFRTYKYSFD